MQWKIVWMDYKLVKQFSVCVCVLNSIEITCIHILLIISYRKSFFCLGDAPKTDCYLCTKATYIPDFTVHQKIRWYKSQLLKNVLKYKTLVWEKYVPHILRRWALLIWPYHRSELANKTVRGCEFGGAWWVVSVSQSDRWQGEPLIVMHLRRWFSSATVLLYFF